MLKKLPFVGGLLTRSQAAFETAGDFVRLAGAAAMLPSAEAAGKVDELVEFLNHSTGVISTRAMGIDPTQRALESWFLFAPRYTRGSIALIFDVFNGTLAGREAVNALGSMLLFGVGGYNAVARAMGQQPELDPRRAAFLTVDIGGQRVGVGTVFRSLLQFTSKVAAMAEGKEDMTLLEGDMSNPLVRLARSRASPVVSTGWDFVYGETFNGIPMSGINPLAYIGTRLLPFSVAGALMEHGDWKDVGTYPGRAVSYGAQFVGLRSFPRQRQDVLNQVAGEQFGKRFDMLSLTEQTQVQMDERVRSLPKLQGERYTLARETGEILEDYQTKVQALGDRVESGQQDAITKREFRIQLGSAQKARNTLVEAARARSPEQVKEPDTREKVAFNEYMRLQTEPGPTGRVDYELAESYLATQNPGTQAYIKEQLRVGTERLTGKAKQLVTELYAARELLKPYWDVFEQELERAGLLEQWRGASGVEREAMMRDRRMDMVERRVRLMRDRMRLRQPEIDSALVEQGYVEKSIRDRRR